MIPLDDYLTVSALQEMLNRTGRIMKRCFSDLLTEQERCHYGMLHRLHCAIETKGSGGQIYVSQLANLFYDTPQAISRSLRILEQDGLILRQTDTNDRRKTIVRLTPAGQQAHDACENAIMEYSNAVFRRLGPERMRSLYENHEALLAAFEAENKSREQRKEGNDE